ncbi:hypothetical protein GCM10022198_05240 [Klugiella xanthotipulae]|uniref:PH domain-containing protein n=1 Tax=Klugiella xanthotipulae TaxID=244735 RepID=A0A543HS96_9MICO|nr:hypothetical protein [Klugiella xanthotipulae]TQM61221.1 hypothetical protein FB466_2162 [Klugiella xanthotipulae]
MERLVPGLIVAGCVVLIFVVMWRAWSRRQRNSAESSALPEMLGDAGFEIFQTRALYVSTTPVNQPVERLALPRLTYRGFCSISVRTTGILVTIQGEAPIALSAELLCAVDTAQLTIDKVVERGGLVALTWTLFDSEGTPRLVDSYFRVTEPDDKSALISAISGLLNTPISSTHPAQEA